MFFFNIKKAPVHNQFLFSDTHTHAHTHNAQALSLSLFRTVAVYPAPLFPTPLALSANFTQTCQNWGHEIRHRRKFPRPWNQWVSDCLRLCMCLCTCVSATFIFQALCASGMSGALRPATPSTPPPHTQVSAFRPDNFAPAIIYL